MEPLTKEENDLLYEISKAEDNYYRSLARIYHEAELYGPLLEASDYVVLNEGVKETIMKYLQSVTAAISKAWNAFKERRVKEELVELINKNRDKLNSDFKMFMPKEFEVPNIDTWDRLFNQIEIKDYGMNYQSWVQNKTLEDADTFIKNQYPELVDGDKSIDQVLHEKIFKVTQRDEVMHKGLVTKYSDFLLRYGDQYNKISKDIDSLNASNKNIEEMLAKITNEATCFLGDKIFTMLYEADNNQPQPSPQEQKEKEEAKFRSADPNDQNSDESKNKLAQDRKYIVTYYKASTKVFSAKLKTCNAIRSASEKIVNNFIKLQMKGKTPEQQNQNNNQQNQQQEQPIRPGTTKIEK